MTPHQTIQANLHTLVYRTSASYDYNVTHSYCILFTFRCLIIHLSSLSLGETLFHLRTYFCATNNSRVFYVLGLFISIQQNCSGFQSLCYQTYLLTCNHFKCSSLVALADNTTNTPHTHYNINYLFTANF